jgi:hypothetical protein
LGLAAAYEKANVAYGVAYLLKSGHITQLSMDLGPLTDTNVKGRQEAATLVYSICKQAAITLLKFGGMLKFMATVMPPEDTTMKEFGELCIVAVNDKQNMRKVFLY